MCSSNILKIMSGAMTLFSFYNKIWKMVYNFYLLACQYANVCKIMSHSHELTSTNSLTIFMDRKGVQYT
jgi:hypothetical protein